ncbi:MAG: tetratricopeptide repeat protein [Candidatus Cloacimonetes bacterium]|nr:tetratricopeptide repeat protein [Candidatus Cloacimonadota bacterium]
MFWKICLLTLVLLAVTLQLSAIFDNDEIFQRGVNAYQERNYELALQSFLHLTEEGVVNAKLYYNIGNTYFRLDNIGHAILYYKKGLRLEPYNQTLQNNLRYSLSLTQDRQVIEETNPILRIVDQIVFTLPLNTLFIIILALFILVVLIINVIIILFSGKEKTIPLFILTIIIFLLLISGGITYYRWQHLHNDSEAVLTASSTTGFSGPADDYESIFRIHEGMIFRINMTQNGWSQITLPSGIIGWIRNDTFQRVHIEV